MKKRIMSGMRPTGRLHIGHYLGVIDNWVKLQEEYECYFAVADWHALTTKFDKTETLRQDTIDVVADWLACGIDPEKATIYVQSLVPETAELNVYLSMITPQHWVEKDPTLKDIAKMIKSGDGQGVSYGLMGYPVLMSADILTFNAPLVPVGVDQVAHVEITRDIARRFNSIYGVELFNDPQPLLNKCSYICGVDGNKMGKSYNNDIKISDNAETTQKRVMQAITDRSRLRRDDLGHTDQCEVAFKYWQIFGTEDEIAEIKKGCETGTIGCADCKRKLAAKVNERFAKIREKREYYETHRDEVETIIKEGSEKARKVAQSVLSEVRKAVRIY